MTRSHTPKHGEAVTLLWLDRGYPSLDNWSRRRRGGTGQDWLWAVEMFKRSKLEGLDSYVIQQSVTTAAIKNRLPSIPRDSPRGKERVESRYGSSIVANE